MGVQLMYSLQDRQTVKNDLENSQTASKAIFLLCYLFYQGLYTLQILCTASLVGQD